MPDPDTSGMEPQVEEKLRETRREVLRDPGSGAAWGKLGMVFHAHDLENEARWCYARAGEASPRDFRWPYLLALVEQSRAPEESLAHIERAVKLNAAYAPAHVLQANVLEQMERQQEAAGCYRKALTVDSELAAAEFALGRLFLAQGSLDDARLHLEKAAQLQPYAGAIQAFLARLYHLQGREELADRATDKARRLDAEVAIHDPVLTEMHDQSVSTIGYESRAKYAEAVGDYLKAESLRRSLVGLHPEEPGVRYNLANLLGRLGKVEEAEEQYRRTLSLDPQHLQAHVNLGNLLAGRGELSRAVEHYRMALQIEPEAVSARVNLSNAVWQSGDPTEAMRLLEMALAIEPDHVPALQGMGQLLAVQGKLDDAVRYLNRALAAAALQRPGEVGNERRVGKIHAVLAEAMARKGDFSSAWRHVQRAQSLGETLPEEFLSALRESMPEPSSISFTDGRSGSLDLPAQS